MADAAPPSPVMLPPSDSDLLLPPTNVPTPEAAARTPNLPDTPASAADPETPFSDAATASDADVSTVAPLYVVAVDDGKEEGINDPSGAARKHMTLAPPAPPTKNSKKKGGNCVWTRPSSRKGKKKAKQPSHAVSGGVGASGGGRPRPSCGEDEFLLTPAPCLAAERNDDGPKQPVLLSRVYKSEMIEVSPA